MKNNGFSRAKRKMKAVGVVVLTFMLFVFTSKLSTAQTIRIHLHWGEKKLYVDTVSYPLSENNDVRIQALKFYLGTICFYDQDKLVWKEKAAYHLIDASKAESCEWKISKPQDLHFTHMQFDLGIDSVTQSQGVLGEDLDPTHGMYWTWQSGYINFKLDGKSTLVKTAKKEFSYHLGGYKKPHDTRVTIIVETNHSDLIFDLKPFLSSIDLLKQNHVMSPGAEAKLLSEKLKLCFRNERP